MRSAEYKNHNSLLHNLGVIAFCYFSYLYFVRNYKRYQLETSLVEKILMRSAVYKNHNSHLHNLGVIALCYISYFCPEHNSKTMRYQPETSLVYNLSRQGAVYKNHNSLLHNLGVIALCYFSYLYLVWSITQNSLPASIIS